MKVGITYNGNNKLYNNGINLNVLVWYLFFKNINYEVDLLTHKQCEPIEGFNIIVYTEQQNTIKLKDYDTIFIIGLSDSGLIKYCINNKIRLIHIDLGYKYQMHIQTLIDEDYNFGFPELNVNEVWISPHFERSLGYLKILYRTSNISVCPYIWNSILLDNQNILNKINTSISFDKLNVGIVEPNINYCKTALIPITIAEQAEKYINNVKVFGGYDLKKIQFIIKYVNRMKLHKEHKISFEHRISIGDILTKYCNCIISTVEDCDLNYVFLECFYLGIPLIHNSPMLKDYGYYYPELNIPIAVEHLKNISKEFNREEYIRKNKPILDKYSIFNPVYQDWIKNKLETSV